MSRDIIKRETKMLSEKKKSPTEFLYQPISFDFSTIKKVICNSLYKGSRVHPAGDESPENRGRTSVGSFFNRNLSSCKKLTGRLKQWRALHGLECLAVSSFCYSALWRSLKIICKTNSVCFSTFSYEADHYLELMIKFGLPWWLRR